MHVRLQVWQIVRVIEEACESLIMQNLKLSVALIVISKHQFLYIFCTLSYHLDEIVTLYVERCILIDYFNFYEIGEIEQ